MAPGQCPFLPPPPLPPSPLPASLSSIPISSLSPNIKNQTRRRGKEGEWGAALQNESILFTTPPPPPPPIAINLATTLYFWLSHFKRGGGGGEETVINNNFQILDLFSLSRLRATICPWRDWSKKKRCDLSINGRRCDWSVLKKH